LAKVAPLGEHRLRGAGVLEREVADYTRDVSPEAWRADHVDRARRLRPDRRRPSPMPVPPLDNEQFVCTMREWIYNLELTGAQARACPQPVSGAYNSPDRRAP